MPTSSQRSIYEYARQWAGFSGSSAAATEAFYGDYQRIYRQQYPEPEIQADTQYNQGQRITFSSGIVSDGWTRARGVTGMDNDLFDIINQSREHEAEWITRFFETGVARTDGVAAASVDSKNNILVVAQHSWASYNGMFVIRGKKIQAWDNVEHIHKLLKKYAKKIGYEFVSGNPEWRSRDSHTLLYWDFGLGSEVDDTELVSVTKPRLQGVANGLRPEEIFVGEYEADLPF